MLLLLTQKIYFFLKMLNLFFWQENFSLENST